MSRRVTVFFVLFVSPLLLSGCGEDQPGQEQTSQKPPENQTTQKPPADQQPPPVTNGNGNGKQGEPVPTPQHPKKLVFRWPDSVPFVDAEILSVGDGQFKLKTTGAADKGLWLGVVPPSDQKHVLVLRLEVREEQRDGVLVVYVGGEAAKKVTVGQSLSLLKPEQGGENIAAAPDFVVVKFEEWEKPSLKIKKPEVAIKLRRLAHAVHQYHSGLDDARPSASGGARPPSPGDDDDDDARSPLTFGYGAMPPAFVLGPDGKPWHSWRVLLLPFLGEKETRLYERYRFDEPWDGPNNKKLLADIPEIYRFPGSDSTFTRFVAAVGKGSLFTEDLDSYKGKSVEELAGARIVSWTFGAVTDGLSFSLMFGEALPDAKIPWTKPEDLAFDGPFPMLGSPGSFAAGYEQDGITFGYVVLGDEKVIKVPKSTSSETLMAMITRAGGRHWGIKILDPPPARPNGVELEITWRDDKPVGTLRPVVLPKD